MLTHLRSYLDHKGPYPARIRARHQQFWSDPNAENIRNTIMYAEQSIDEWKNVKQWQRRLSNKHNARQFATKFGCKVPKLYWEGRNIDLFDFSSLPENYVIRPTIGHSSNFVFIMKNGYNLFDRNRYTPNQIKDILFKQARSNIYLNFLIEEFLANEDGEIGILKDYKIYCFNGQIACIWVIDRLSPSTGFSCFYDENWKQMKTVITKYPQGLCEDSPACLSEMIEQAKILSKAYEIFVRIDFYATDNGAVFGEFTPTPCMGGSTTKYGQRLLMSYWDKCCNGLI